MAAILAMFGLRLFIVSHVPFLHPRFVPTVIHFTRRCGSCSANHRELSFRENGCIYYFSFPFDVLVPIEISAVLGLGYLFDRLWSFFFYFPI